MGSYIGSGRLMVEDSPSQGEGHPPRLQGRIGYRDVS